MGSWINMRAEEIKARAREDISAVKSSEDYADVIADITYEINHATEIAEKEYQEKNKLARGRMLRDLFKKW